MLKQSHEKKKKRKVRVLVAQLCPTLCDPQTIACQALLYTGFSRQEYWSGLPFPSPGDLPTPGMEPKSPASKVVLYCLSHQGRRLIWDCKNQLLNFQEFYKTRIFIPWKIAHAINQSAPPLLPPLVRELVYQHTITRKL